jgi:RNA polymerase sigma factor (sigma-70 family)
LLTESHITAAQSGDPAAINEFLSAASPLVRAMCGRVLGEHSDYIDDAVQESLIKIWRNLHRYQSDSVTNWVATIATNTSRDIRRSPTWRRQHYDIDAMWWLPGGDDPADTVLRQDDTRCLYAAISELSELQRDAVWLVCIEGVKPPVAGKALGMTVKGVYMTVNAGKRTLRRRMSGQIKQGVQ